MISKWLEKYYGKSPGVHELYEPIIKKNDSTVCLPSYSCPPTQRCVCIYGYKIVNW